MSFFQKIGGSLREIVARRQAKASPKKSAAVANGDHPSQFAVSQANALFRAAFVEAGLDFNAMLECADDQFIVRHIAKSRAEAIAHAGTAAREGHAGRLNELRAERAKLAAEKVRLEGKLANAEVIRKLVTEDLGIPLTASKAEFDAAMDVLTTKRARNMVDAEGGAEFGPDPHIEAALAKRRAEKAKGSKLSAPLGKVAAALRARRGLMTDEKNDPAFKNQN